MIINSNTKISALIKQNSEALEAVISISPKFIKLRNPLLRKVIAGRTTISMASKLGGCTVDDFFNKLQPLGFEIDGAIVAKGESAEDKQVPYFFKSIQPDNLVELDVRPVIKAGKDPLDVIMKEVKELKAGHVINIINSFEPTPLMHLLGKQGFESYAEFISDELVNTYFNKKTGKPLEVETNNAQWSSNWDEILKRYDGKLETVDVRELQMPLPMHTILEALETLPAHKALFVYHKRIPVFLLPELEEQKFTYRIKEVSDGEVNILIYKD
ncbi:MAG: DUF2249 domain-containing protein [Chitinophagaceae bacterium]